MKKGFTLLELIVVIIIIGILATLGYTQYTKIVEKGRQAEAKAILGLMRKSAIEYYWKNGTVDGMQNSDLNVGTGSSQIPSSCVSTNYFYYDGAGVWPSPSMIVRAHRCTSGGKSPQGNGQMYSLCFAMDGSKPDMWCIDNFDIPVGGGSCPSGTW